MKRDCGNCAYEGKCNQRRSCVAGRQTPWHETQEEIEAGLAWGRRKAFFMRWVKVKMQTGLSRRQREVVELHLFRGMTYRQIARVTGTDRSTVSRAMQRSVKRLRRIWQAETSCPGAAAPKKKRPR